MTLLAVAIPYFILKTATKKSLQVNVICFVAIRSLKEQLNVILYSNNLHGEIK